MDDGDAKSLEYLDGLLVGTFYRISEGFDMPAFASAA